ncbi:hypothetical protein D3C84_581840 [compost metagenome]
MQLQDRKLVAAQAGDHIALAGTVLEARGDFLQQQVADRVTEGIVDFLEVVEIQVEDRERGGAALGRGEGLAQALDEGRPVGQAGEPVGAGEQGDFLLGQLALGDVEDDAFDLDQPALAVAHRDIAVLDPAVSVGAGQQAEFDRGALGALLQHLPHRRVEHLQVVRVDQLLRPVRRGHQAGGIVAELGDVVRDVHQGKRRLAAQAVEDGRAVAHDDVGVGQLLGSFLDRLLQGAHLHGRVLGHLPLHGERTGQLADLDRVEGLLQDQQAVAQVEALGHFLPGIVGVGGAEGNLQLGVGLPELLDGLDPIPAGRHAHVDERHGVGPPLRQRAGEHGQGFLALMGGVEFEGVLHGRGVAEQGRLGGGQHGLAVLAGAENLAEVLVDRRVVVD